MQNYCGATLGGDRPSAMHLTFLSVLTLRQGIQHACPKTIVETLDTDRLRTDLKGWSVAADCWTLNQP
jgi:hypothetical protein